MHIICTTCRIHHIISCRTCFGFGFYTRPGRPGELLLVSAGAAHSEDVSGLEVRPCPECGSTIRGIASPDLPGGIE